MATTPCFRKPFAAPPGGGDSICSPTEIRISDGPDAVRVVVDSAGHAFEMHAETLDEDVLTPTKPIRLGLKVTAPVTALQFKLTITPELN